MTVTEVEHAHSFHPWRDTDGGYFLQYRRCELDGCEKMETREGPMKMQSGWIGQGPCTEGNFTPRTVLYYTGGASDAAAYFNAFMVRLLWSTFLFCHGARVRR